MIWMTTWPLSGIPQYAEHATEAEAEAHAHQLIKSRAATVATIFQMETLALPDEEQP